MLTPSYTPHNFRTLLHPHYFHPLLLHPSPLSPPPTPLTTRTPSSYTPHYSHPLLHPSQLSPPCKIHSLFSHIQYINYGRSLLYKLFALGNMTGFPMEAVTNNTESDTVCAYSLMYPVHYLDSKTTFRSIAANSPHVQENIMYSEACLIRHPLGNVKQCWISRLLDYRGQFVW